MKTLFLVHQKGPQGLNVGGQHLCLYMQPDQFNQFTCDQFELRRFDDHSWVISTDTHHLKSML